MHWIRASSRAAVQTEIFKFTDMVDARGGFAQFIGPHREGEDFVAIGEVILEEAS